MTLYRRIFFDESEIPLLARRRLDYPQSHIPLLLGTTGIPVSTGTLAGTICPFRLCCFPTEMIQKMLAKSAIRTKPPVTLGSMMLHGFCTNGWLNTADSPILSTIPTNSFLETVYGLSNGTLLATPLSVRTGCRITRKLRVLHASSITSDLGIFLISLTQSSSTATRMAY